MENIKRKSISIAMCAISIFGSNALYAKTLAQDNMKERFIIKLNPEYMLNELGKTQYLHKDMNEAKVTVIESFASKAGLTLTKRLIQQDAMVAYLTQSELKALKANHSVKFIEGDPKRYLQSESIPYGISLIQANQLPDVGAANRKVCIMDTGYTLGHPDLPHANITGDDGYGEFDSGNWFEDGHGHGTHVAGTIAAIGGNDLGVVGVNPSGELGLHIVKVFDSQGSWTYGSTIAEAVYQCAAAGANVINMSLGGNKPSELEREAFNTTYQQGVLHIAAAGNSGFLNHHYPASYDDVVSVAAVDEQGMKASFSTYNDQVEVAAPGVKVNSTTKNGEYGNMSGTSMATPHVSGAAALLWGYFPNCTNQQIRQALQVTALDKGPVGRDNEYGFGVIQVLAAKQYLDQQACELPVGLPVANFTYRGNLLEVSFTDTSTDNDAIVSHQWAFGDGTSSVQQNPIHTYDKEGTYMVRLVVTDSEGHRSLKIKAVNADDGIAPICDDRAQWQQNKHYRIGDKVKYLDKKYTAIHWGAGATPDVFTHVWKFDGLCDDPTQNAL
ncbi:S8 family serine peptidase [Pseudoalteromonas sp. JBTF-M23]|uniref:S8 family serine peptidase n=1 Tax=Pseudoalteromonas caenipelagi TaxID=2726988 RepID=A0A849VKU0_9GAMM|nr:S8 family serine peptidase [Pseudoalteromonas caenipelagi]NOU52227.1 S8 family serine peptidase [Pseudoalteromonas caenipelagi]